MSDELEKARANVQAMVVIHGFLSRVLVTNPPSSDADLTAIIETQVLAMDRMNEIVAYLEEQQRDDDEEELLPAALGTVAAGVPPPPPPPRGPPGPERRSGEAKTHPHPHMSRSRAMGLGP